ncbi:MAG: STAS domain-containing protein [Magnetococcus sp. MYC-9]
MIKDGGTVYVMLPNVFSFDFRDEFRAAITGNPTAVKYEVDFQKVERIDSAALGMLLMLREGARDQSSVVLTNVGPNIYKMLQLVNFQKLFKIQTIA